MLNLLAIEAESGHRPEYRQQPLFRNKILNTALIIKHRLRNDDLYLFDEARQTATKVIIPFDRDDLKYGGQSVFVGQRGWRQMLIEACNASGNLSRDLETLEAIDALPSLDPFLLREHLRRHRIVVAGCYFTPSPADYEAMQGFVGMEIAHLIELAYRDAGGLRRTHAARLVEALLAADVDERLEPLRNTLVMEGAQLPRGRLQLEGLPLLQVDADHAVADADRGRRRDQRHHRHWPSRRRGRPVSGRGPQAPAGRGDGRARPPSCAR
ncbi:hypothetical protein ACRAWD_01540 [Caulobacter segnis]